MTHIIDSRSQPLKPLKWYRQLATQEGRQEAGAFFVEGERAIWQIISSHPESVSEIIMAAEPSPTYRNYTIRVVTDSQFRYICSTRTPQGIMAVARLPRETYFDQLPDNTGSKILLLEDIQDPGNVGTLIRTASAFNFSGVILTEKCADPFSPKCVQATAGAVLSVWLRRTVRYLEIMEMLQKSGYSLIATELRGATDTSVLSRPKKLLLALGNEAAGLSETVLTAAEYRLQIPTVQEKVASLNVATCGAICMYLSSREP